MSNTEIKRAIKEKGLKQWEVAEALGVAETTLTRWLRKDPEPEKEAEIFNAIHKLAEDKLRAKLAGSAPVVINK